jgi:glyoxalase family protein
MDSRVHGIHHVTAVAADGQQMLDFYVGLLGMRLVKKSVNQDLPDTYHLFFADGPGTPGTDLTFFIWPRSGPAPLGRGSIVEVGLAIPPGSLAYWQERLSLGNVACQPPERRFGAPALPFQDWQGLRLALVEETGERTFVPWSDSPVPQERQLRGLYSVRQWEGALGPTEALLTQTLGFERLGREAGWLRYTVAGGAPGGVIELQEQPGLPPGDEGTGGVHHVAWRVRDDDEQNSLRDAVLAQGLRATPQIDRFWFRSVYFKEPGGVLFELATDGPGFDRDEEPAHLGEQLILPPWLEPRRAELTAALPVLQPPRRF